MASSMGESVDGTMEASDSFTTADLGSKHVNGETNGFEDEETTEPTLNLFKSIINNASADNDDSSSSDEDSISSKENGGVEVPIKDSAKSSLHGTKVPASDLDEDKMDVDKGDGDSDSDSSIKHVAMDVDPLDSSLNDRVTSNGNADEETKDSSDSSHKVDSELKENGDSLRSHSPDIEEISNDSMKTPEKKEDGRGGKDDSSADDVKNSDSTPAKVKKPRKSLPAANITPRRSSRNLTRVQKSYSEPKESDVKEPVEEESDVEEIVAVDPLADSKPIIVKDTRKLVEIAAGARAMKGGAKKEPTLVIIDTNSILAGRGPIPVSQSQSHHRPSPMASTSRSTHGYTILPVGLPSQGMMYPKARITPYNQAYSRAQPIPITIPAPKPQPPPVPILPTLTDDMYVVEAPSFIVPYVYEKPPIKPLKDYIKKLSVEIEKQTKLEEEEEKKEKESKLKDKEGKSEQVETHNKENDKEDVKKDELDLKEKKEDKEDEKEKEDNKVDNKVDKESSVADTSKESADLKESSKDVAKDTDKDVAKEKASEDSEAETKKTEKAKDKENSDDSEDSEDDSEDEGKTKKKAEAAKPADKVASVIDDVSKATDVDKPKVPTYFDNPLGKFFMQIGTNLVNEFVQTDLLRHQKRKRDREGKISASAQFAVNALLSNLEISKENNKPFHLPIKKCEFCSFKTESALVMAQHLETPHMRNYVYRCNFCPLEVRNPHDILFHMEAEHNVRGRLDRAPAFHQCPSCPFEDNQKGKLTRHLLGCAKKFRPDKNLEPPTDWEPPAKIPRVSRNRPTSMGLGTAAYQAMIAKQGQHHSLLPKLLPTATITTPVTIRGRGRPSMGKFFPDMKITATGQRPIQTTTMRPGMQLIQHRASGSQVLLPNTYQISGSNPLGLFQVVGSQGQMMQGSTSRITLMPQGRGPTPVALVPNISAGSNSITIQTTNNKHSGSKDFQPSISITPLPRQQATASSHSKMQAQQGSTPGKTYVICEICDGYIKDLEQLRNHMLWIHKVKIHPKMIHNRPPLNCQKCQCRFFTDQGLERHLLGTHGLVTSSMQEAANKGKDAGRCPACGRVYQWKLLNHVARDHGMVLKPAHLSYKCTVCTATFGMYKQFENHVYSAHSTQAKRVMDKKPTTTSQVYRTPTSESSKSLLKPLKMNDEITIIPQPAPAPSEPGPASKTGKPAATSPSKSMMYTCQICDAMFDGPTGFAQFTGHMQRQHLSRCHVKITRLDKCAELKEKKIVTQEMLDFLEELKNSVDVIELSDDECVIAGQGRNEITITKVASPPGPRRFKNRLQRSRGSNVQVIEIDDSPQKSQEEAKENGEDSLSAVKERLRRRKSLEISQVDSDFIPTPSAEAGSSRKRRRNND